MPRMRHWIVQYLLAASTMFGLLVLVGLLRGTAFSASWAESLTLAAALAAIFIGRRYQQSRKGGPER